MVGGTIPSRIARMEAASFDSAGRTEEVAGHGFGRGDDEAVFGVVAKGFA